MNNEITNSDPIREGKNIDKNCLSKPRNGNYFNLKGKQAEEFVQILAEKTFLEDWCYKTPKLPNGKELCDLLIVFDDVAIVWQIKDLKLGSDGLYKESEVEKNIRQLSGARRSLFDLKKTIELKNPRRGKEIFDPSVIKEVYLISALLGEPQCSLNIFETWNGKLIHVFTREFTELVLKELDTIRDFICYLKEKEKLFSESSIKITILGEEKELLANYLIGNRSFKKFPEMSLVVIDEGCWNDFINKPEYLAKKNVDEISYCWDGIINRAHTCGGQYEMVAREMARPNRFERRCLAKVFFDAHVKSDGLPVNRNTFRRVIEMDGITFCFMFLDDSEPRETRRDLLGAFCFITRGKYLKNKKVLGVATELKICPECSYDFCLIELPEWTDAQQKVMEKIQKETGFLSNLKMSKLHEDEYPSQ